MSISDPLSSGLFFRRRAHRPRTPSTSTPPASRRAPSLLHTPGSRPSSLLSSLPPSTAPAASLRELVERNEQPLAVRAAAAALRAVHLEPDTNAPLYASALQAAQSVCQQGRDPHAGGKEARRLFDEEEPVLDGAGFEDNQESGMPTHSFSREDLLPPHMPSLADDEEAGREGERAEGDRLASLPHRVDFDMESLAYPVSPNHSSAHIHLATHSFTPLASVGSLHHQDNASDRKNEDNSSALSPTPTRTIRTRSSPHGVQAASIRESPVKRKGKPRRLTDTRLKSQRRVAAEISKPDVCASRTRRAVVAAVEGEARTPRATRASVAAAEAKANTPRTTRASVAAAEAGNSMPRATRASARATGKEPSAVRTTRASSRTTEKDADRTRKTRGSSDGTEKSAGKAVKTRGAIDRAEKDSDTMRKTRESVRVAEKEVGATRVTRTSAGIAEKNAETTAFQPTFVDGAVQGRGATRRTRASAHVPEKEVRNTGTTRSSSSTPKHEANTPRLRRASVMAIKKEPDSSRPRRHSAPIALKARKRRRSRLSEVLKLQKSLETAQWTNSRAVSQQTEVIVISDDEPPAQTAKSVLVQRNASTASAKKTAVTVKKQLPKETPRRLARSTKSDVRGQQKSEEEEKSEQETEQSSSESSDKEWTYSLENEDVEEDLEEQSLEVKVKKKKKNNSEDDEDEDVDEGVERLMMDEMEGEEDEDDEDEEDDGEDEDGGKGSGDIPRNKGSEASRTQKTGEREEELHLHTRRSLAKLSKRKPQQRMSRGRKRDLLDVEEAKQGSESEFRRRSSRRRIKDISNEGESAVESERRSRRENWQSREVYEGDEPGVRHISEGKSHRRKSRADNADLQDDGEVQRREQWKSRLRSSDTGGGALGDSPGPLDRIANGAAKLGKRTRGRRAAPGQSLADGAMEHSENGKESQEVIRPAKTMLSPKRRPRRVVVGSPASSSTTPRPAKQARVPEPFPVDGQKGIVLESPIRRSPRFPVTRNDAALLKTSLQAEMGGLVRRQALKSAASPRRRKGRPRKSKEGTRDVLAEMTEGLRQSDDNTTKIDVENVGVQGELKQGTRSAKRVAEKSVPGAVLPEQESPEKVTTPSRRKRRRIAHIVEEELERNVSMDDTAKSSLEPKTLDEAGLSAELASKKRRRNREQEQVMRNRSTDSVDMSTRKAQEEMAVDGTDSVVPSPERRPRAVRSVAGRPAQVQKKPESTAGSMVEDSEDEGWEAGSLSDMEWDSIIHGWMLHKETQKNGMNWVGLAEMWQALRCPFGLGKNAEEIVAELREGASDRNSRKGAISQQKGSSSTADEEQKLSKNETGVGGSQTGGKASVCRME